MLDENELKVMITMRTIVTGSETDNIIGRGGKMVKSFRDESGDTYQRKESTGENHYSKWT